EFHHRSCLGRAVRLLRWTVTGEGDLLRREPGRDRADPALLLPVDEARNEGLARVGVGGSGVRHHGGGPGGGGTRVHWLWRRRACLLWFALSRASIVYDTRIPVRLASCRRRRVAEYRFHAPSPAARLLPPCRLADLPPWPR